MHFTDAGARKRAEQLRDNGTYVEGRFFGERADLAARFATALALEYGRDVQVVERVVFPRGTFDAMKGRPSMRRTARVFALATATATGHGFT